MVPRIAVLLFASFALSPVALAGEPGGVPAPPSSKPWVAVHKQASLWSGDDKRAAFFGFARVGARFQLAGRLDGKRLHVWDPINKNYAYIDARSVGPATGPLTAAERKRQEEALRPKLEYLWTGTARVTMYTCYELGGCNATRIGIWPYEGVVAVDPRVIPLGSTVWIDGLGIFLAADTGSLVYGNRIDVFVHDYHRAIHWGVQYLNAAAYVTP
jgi:3D (Asp-Asp-Asp) domain-containing protein